MISGDLFIGFTRVRTGEHFQAVAAADGHALSPPFSIAGAIEVERACALADKAFDAYRNLTAGERAQHTKREGLIYDATTGATRE